MTARTADGVRLRVDVELGTPERERPDFDQQFPLGVSETMKVESERLSDYQSGTVWGYDDHWLVVVQSPSGRTEYDLHRASITLDPQRRLTVLARAGDPSRSELRRLWKRMLASAAPLE